MPVDALQKADVYADHNVRQLRDRHAADAKSTEGGGLLIRGIETGDPGCQQEHCESCSQGKAQGKAHAIGKDTRKSLPVTDTVIDTRYGDHGIPDTDADAEDYHIKLILDAPGNNSHRGNSKQQVEPVDAKIPQGDRKALHHGRQAGFCEFCIFPRAKNTQGKPEEALLSQEECGHHDQLDRQGSGGGNSHTEGSAVQNQGVDQIPRNVSHTHDNSGNGEIPVAVIHDDDRTHDLHENQSGNPKQIPSQVGQHMPVQVGLAGLCHTAEGQQRIRKQDTHQDDQSGNQQPGDEAERKNVICFIPFSLPEEAGKDDLVPGGQERGEHQEDSVHRPEQDDAGISVVSQKAAGYNSVDKLRRHADEKGKDHRSRGREKHFGNHVFPSVFFQNVHSIHTPELLASRHQNILSVHAFGVSSFTISRGKW